MSEQTNGVWRPVYIDGATLVCINGTGDLPLFMYQIDPTRCSFEQVGGPILPPAVVVVPPLDLPPHVAPVPEPSTYLLVVLGLVLVALHRRARA